MAVTAHGVFPTMHSWSLNCSETDLHAFATMWCFTCFTQGMAHLLSCTSSSLLHMQCHITFSYPSFYQNSYPRHNTNLFRCKGIPVTCRYGHGQPRSALWHKGFLSSLCSYTFWYWFRDVAPPLQGAVWALLNYFNQIYTVFIKHVSSCKTLLQWSPIT